MLVLLAGCSADAAASTIAATKGMRDEQKALFEELKGSHPEVFKGARYDMFLEREVPDVTSLRYREDPRDFGKLKIPFRNAHALNLYNLWVLRRRMTWLLGSRVAAELGRGSQPWSSETRAALRGIIDELMRSGEALKSESVLGEDGERFFLTALLRMILQGIEAKVSDSAWSSIEALGRATRFVVEARQGEGVAGDGAAQGSDTHASAELCARAKRVFPERGNRICGLLLSKRQEGEVLSFAWAHAGEELQWVDPTTANRRFWSAMRERLWVLHRRIVSFNGDWKLLSSELESLAQAPRETTGEYDPRVFSAENLAALAEQGPDAELSWTEVLLAPEVSLEIFEELTRLALQSPSTCGR